MLAVEDIAALCHEANRRLCSSHGDDSQKTWEEASQWQRDSAISGVRFRLAAGSSELGPVEQHTAWMTEKIKQGWTYGPVKDEVKKTHPCLVAYDELPPEQQMKDALFIGIVEACRAFVDPTC